MTLAYVNFREATAEDFKELQPNWIYSTAAYLPYKMVQLWGTVQYMSNVKDLLGWKEPAALKVFYWSQYYLGFKPERPFLNVRPSIFGDSYSVNDQRAINAFFRFHRNDSEGFFSSGRGVSILANFLMECFPGTTMEDCILTCSPTNTKLLHTLLQKKLTKPEISASFRLMSQQAEETLSTIPNGEVVNFTHIAPEYLAKVFGQILLNDSQTGNELASFIGPFKNYIAQRATMTALFKSKIFGVDPQDAKQIEEMQAKIRLLIAKILDKEEELEIFQGFQAQQLTKAQKQMLIFVVLFAAQDNTSTLLLAAIYEMANLSEEEQEALANTIRQHHDFQERGAFKFPPEVDRFFANVLRKYPPALGIARSVTKDLCMEYSVEGNPEIKKVILPAGSNFTARIFELAKKTITPSSGSGEILYHSFSPFGGGPHRCPGQYLTDVEIKEFIYQLLLNYKIRLPAPYELKMKLQFTGILDRDVEAILEKRPATI